MRQQRIVKPAIDSQQASVNFADNACYHLDPKLNISAMLVVLDLILPGQNARSCMQMVH